MNAMYISVKTTTRNELVDITSKIKELVDASGLTDGICFVFCPHTTGAITINENADPTVKTDLLMTLDKVFPVDPAYRHMEGNSDSHVKSSLVGASEMIAVEDGHLVLGTWQGIYFCEFDGPRNRKVYIKFV